MITVRLLYDLLYRTLNNDNNLSKPKFATLSCCSLLKLALTIPQADPDDNFIICYGNF